MPDFVCLVSFNDLLNLAIVRTGTVAAAPKAVLNQTWKTAKGLTSNTGNGKWKRVVNNE